MAHVRNCETSKKHKVRKCVQAVVAWGGFEPSTLRLRRMCANHLAKGIWLKLLHIWNLYGHYTDSADNTRISHWTNKYPPLHSQISHQLEQTEKTNKQKKKSVLTFKNFCLHHRVKRAHMTFWKCRLASCPPTSSNTSRQL